MRAELVRKPLSNGEGTSSYNLIFEFVMFLMFFFFVVVQAAQQQKPVMISPTKLAVTNTVLSRSYNSGPVMSAPRAVSATQIAKELLQKQGIQGLYKGLGATLMRWSSFLFKNSFFLPLHIKEKNQTFNIY